jgi:hypothetical protein
MAVAGQPVHGRHLSCRYSAQSAQGTAVTPATSPGLLSGFRFKSNSGMQSIYNIGSPNAKFLKPGEAIADWGMDFSGIQTKSVLELMERASGLVSWLTLEFGTNFDSGSDHGFQVQDCKPNELSLSLSAPGLLTGSMSGQGGLVTDISTIAMAHLSETPMAHYEAVLLKGGAAWESAAFNLTIGNNIEVSSVIPGTAPSTFKRGWAYQTEGQESIAGTITRFVRSSLDPQSATISDFTILLTMTDIVGGMSPTAIVISCTGAKFSDEEFTGNVNGLASYTSAFSALAYTIA